MQKNGIYDNSMGWMGFGWWWETRGWKWVGCDCRWLIVCDYVSRAMPLKEEHVINVALSP